MTKIQSNILILEKWKTKINNFKFYNRFTRFACVKKAFCTTRKTSVLCKCWLGYINFTGMAPG